MSRRPGHLLLCTPDAPDAARQSGSLRLLNIVELLREAGWSVTMVSTYPGRHVDRRRFLRLGVPIFAESELGEVLSGNPIDVALIAFWETAERLIPAIKARSPQTKIVIDSVDLHFVRRMREQVGGGGDAPATLDSVVGSEFIREINAYVSADAVLTVSEKEAWLLGDLTNGGARGLSVPDCEDAASYPRWDEPRRGVVFVGNFQHPPNRDAVEFLCERIVPSVAPPTLAEHPVSVVGNALAGDILERCREAEGVRPVGWVPSVIPYLASARVSIVPLRFGAGTKRKVIQSLMAGTPTVATPVAVEGMGLADGEGIRVEEDPRRFAAAIDRIANDDAAWRELLAGGREAVTAGFDRAHVRRILLETIDSIVAGEPGSAPSAPVPFSTPRSGPGAAPAATAAPAPARASAAGPRADGQPAPPIRPPIVIFGAPRSGTTYLNRIINEHPDVFVSHESRIFAWAHRAMRMADDPQAVLSHRPQVKAHLESQLPRLIRDFYRGLRPRIEHWGDKNPHYASPVDEGCLETTETLFPGAKFIHVIRDGRDVVASLIRKRNDAGDPWAPFEIAHDVWNSHTTLGRAFAEHVPPERFLEVRYEELIADDVAVARQVFEFLEIDICDPVIEFCEGQRRERTPLSGPTRDLSRGPGESDWDTVLTAEEQRRSLDLLGANLVRFGYLDEAELGRERAQLGASAAD